MDLVQTTFHFQGELDKDTPCPLFSSSWQLSSYHVSKIRRDKEIQGLNIFQKEKVSQFAGDSTLLNSNKNSVKRAIDVLDNFGDLSGLNPSKTKALWLGPWTFCKEKPFGFQWPEKPVRILGSYVSCDVKQNEKLNFETKLQKMQGIFDICNCRNLTILGKCLIAKGLHGNRPVGPHDFKP